MKKFLFVFVILTCLTYSASMAEGSKDSKEASTSLISVSGTITDQHTGEALAGVSVSLEEIDLSVYTDFNGGFKFNGLTPGDYTLKATYISYKESSSKFKVKSNEKNNLLVKLTSMAY